MSHIELAIAVSFVQNKTYTKENRTVFPFKTILFSLKTFSLIFKKLLISKQIYPLMRQARY